MPTASDATSRFDSEWNAICCRGGYRSTQSPHDEVIEGGLGLTRSDRPANCFVIFINSKQLNNNMIYYIHANPLPTIFAMTGFVSFVCPKSGWLCEVGMVIFAKHHRCSLRSSITWKTDIDQGRLKFASHRHKARHTLVTLWLPTNNATFSTFIRQLKQNAIN